ncbi:MAG: hypothetical protein HYU27_06675 [Acidobacteria bacterium]|nr:hypothetical protein [Acidobacteriota bacterium]
MKTKLVLLLPILFAVPLPLLSHHSFAAEYDANKAVKVTGVLRAVEWKNPHIWFYLEVKDEKTSKTTVWGFSGGPPGMLLRRGITRDSLKTGDVIMVEGFQAKDGSNNASGGNVTFADGRRVFAGATEDVVPR